MTTEAPKKSPVAQWVALLVVVPLTALVAIVLDRNLTEPAAHGEHGDHGKEEGHAEEGHAEHGVGRVKLTDEGRKNAGIEIAKAAPGNVSVTLSLPGEVTLNADKTAHVTPRVAGTVKEVKRHWVMSSKRATSWPCWTAKSWPSSAARHALHRSD